VRGRLYPQDKQRNADGRRRAKAPLVEQAGTPARAQDGAIAPLLRQIIARYASTGLPPAYLPKDEHDSPERKHNHE